MKLELGPKRWAAMTVWADIAYCLTVTSLPFFVSFRTQILSWGAALIDRDGQWNISRSCWAGASKAFFKGNDSAGKEGGGALCLYPSVWKAEMMADIQQPDELEDRNSTLLLGEAASGLQPFHPPPDPIRMGAGCETLPGLELKIYADSAGLIHTAWEYLPLFQVQCGLLCSADVCASVAIGSPQLSVSQTPWGGGRGPSTVARQVLVSPLPYVGCQGTWWLWGTVTHYWSSVSCSVSPLWAYHFIQCLTGWHSGSNSEANMQ